MTQCMWTRWVIFATAAAALAGCSSISSTLGLERHIPDESQVVVRPALTLPPDYDLMPPGTATAVSADHENGLAKGGVAVGSAAPAPQKEERGFFGNLTHGFGLFDKSDVVKGDAAKEEAPSTAYNGAAINGTPQAPPREAPAPEAVQPAPTPQTADATSPPKKEERGFFGNLVHGFGLFDSDKGKSTGAVPDSLPDPYGAPPTPGKTS